MNRETCPGFIAAFNSQWGLTLIELTVTLAIIGLVVSIGFLYLKPMETPLQTSGQRLEGMLKQVRARAIETTTSHRVVPSGSTGIVVESAASCKATLWTAEPRLEVNFPAQVDLVETDWSVCFDNRGIASENLVLTLQHPDHGSRQLEILRGGLLRWL